MLLISLGALSGGLRLSAPSGRARESNGPGRRGTAFPLRASGQPPEAPESLRERPPWLFCGLPLVVDDFDFPVAFRGGRRLAPVSRCLFFPVGQEDGRTPLLTGRPLSGPLRVHGAGAQEPFALR